jgi:Ribbon-helix-helix protein, copG family
MATTVRIDEQVAAKLRDLANEECRPIGQVIRDAVEHYQKEKFWREVEVSVMRLRADPDAWRDYQEEIRFFEGGSMDGLEQEDPYYTEVEAAWSVRKPFAALSRLLPPSLSDSIPRNTSSSTPTLRRHPSIS